MSEESASKIAEAERHWDSLGVMRALGVLVTETYSDCSILFSKLEGLDELVSDEMRSPPS